MCDTSFSAPEPEGRSVGGRSAILPKRHREALWAERHPLSSVMVERRAFPALDVVRSREGEHQLGSRIVFDRI